MNILLYSDRFYPTVGGLQTYTLLLCSELSKLGHDVTLITPVKGSDDYDKQFCFKVLRSISYISFFKYYLSCDVFFHCQISLKGVIPWIILPIKPWVCSYHLAGWGAGIRSRLKMYISRFSHNIAVSNIVARSLRLKNAKVIYNAYNNHLFTDQSHKQRNGFVFVGTLNKTKGVDLLINSFNIFLKNNRETKHNKLLIIGDGSERENIKKKIHLLNLEEYIDLKGCLTGTKLADEISKCFCLVAPSIDMEAFGIVALEGMASGCITLVSDGNGLSEAVQDGGLTFKRGSVNDLYEKMEVISRLRYEEILYIKEKAKKVCTKRTTENVTKEYERFLYDIVKK